jgi:hypothetical protein
MYGFLSYIYSALVVGTLVINTRAQLSSQHGQTQRRSYASARRLQSAAIFYFCFRIMAAAGLHRGLPSMSRYSVTLMDLLTLPPYPGVRDCLQIIADLRLQIAALSPCRVFGLD